MTLIPPMPAERVNLAPAVAAMDALDLGALWALANAFWQGGGKPLPDCDATLSVLAKCHTRRWYLVRAKVLPVWRKLEAELVSVYSDRLRVSESNRETAMYAARVRVAGLRRKAELEGGADPNRVGARLVPQRESLKENNRSLDGSVIPKRVARGNAVKFHDAKD